MNWSQSNFTWKWQWFLTWISRNNNTTKINSRGGISYSLHDASTNLGYRWNNICFIFKINFIIKNTHCTSSTNWSIQFNSILFVTNKFIKSGEFNGQSSESLKFEEFHFFHKKYQMWWLRWYPIQTNQIPSIKTRNYALFLELFFNPVLYTSITNSLHYIPHLFDNFLTRSYWITHQI